MAATPPSCLIHFLNDVPEHHLAYVLQSLKITETEFFKKYCVSHVGSSMCRDFILSLFNTDKVVIQTLYHKIEGVLIIGGCAPGLGIAFNIIDACFCYILCNWLGLVVAILSCFPIPGFKAAGKGLEKFLTVAIKNIPLKKLVNNFTKTIGDRITLLHRLMDAHPYVTIQKEIKKYVTELNNPFSEEIIIQLNRQIEKFGPRLTEKTISDSVNMTEFPHLLDLLKRETKLH